MGNYHAGCGAGEKSEITSKSYLSLSLEQNRTWIIEIRDNEDYYLVIENTMLPTLVIRKWNALRNRPVPMTQFRIEFEVPNSPNVQLLGHRMTDQDGFIIIPFVGVGWYRVTETRPAPGMTLNVNNSYRVFLQPGQNTYQFLEHINNAGLPHGMRPPAGSPFSRSLNLNLLNRAVPQLPEGYEDMTFISEDLPVDMIVPELEPTEELPPQLRMSSLLVSNVGGIENNILPTGQEVDVFFNLTHTGQRAALTFDLTNTTNQPIPFDHFRADGVGVSGHASGLSVTTDWSGDLAPGLNAGITIELEVTNGMLLANTVNNDRQNADVWAYLHFWEGQFIDFYIAVLTQDFVGEDLDGTVSVDIVVPQGASIEVEFNGTYERTLTSSSVLEVPQRTEVSLTVIPDEGYGLDPDWNNGEATYTFIAAGLWGITVAPTVIQVDPETDTETDGEDGEEGEEGEESETDPDEGGSEETDTDGEDTDSETDPEEGGDTDTDEETDGETDTDPDDNNGGEEKPIYLPEPPTDIVSLFQAVRAALLALRVTRP